MKALVLDQIDNRTVATVKDIDLPALAEGDVRVAIDWSSLNYKDALAITGKGKIIRQFPMVPGIDFAGQVKESRDPRFVPGQAVILTGWGVGENHWGGLATEACVKSDWLVALPETLSARQAMIIGTAGFTAMLCVDALVSAGVTPDSGDILVTGASGGVGSTAVVLLKALGYRVGNRHTITFASWAPIRSCRAATSRRPVRWRNSCGRARWIPLAARCWPKCWRKRNIAAASPPAVWPGASICRPP